MVGPFTVKRLAEAAEALGARLLVVDYVQRFRASDGAREPRQVVAEVMDDLRKLANAGAAVFVLSALARTRGSRGSSYDGADPLTQFRDSSELEFGTDEAYVLERADKDTGFLATLKHGKCRHGELRDLVLRFDGARQAFETPMLPELARATVGAP
jgi:replicative DNA helicase